MFSTKLKTMMNLHIQQQQIILHIQIQQKLGTTSSGTKTIDASSGWKEGHYYLYVRGVDKGGIKSPEKAIGFVIDRTAPVLNSVTITPYTSASSYINKLPKITWNVTEKIFCQFR